MAKPTDFLLGVTDLFSVVLPGASMTYVLMKVEEHFHRDLLGLLALSHTTEGYVAFFAMAYMVGNGTDMVGGMVLDPLYDLTFAHWKRSRDISIFGWCAGTPKRLLLELRRTLGYPVPKAAAGVDSLLERAAELSALSIPKNDRVYKWSRAWVFLRNPAASSEIERLQANSKFFRGMVTTFVIVALLSVTIRVPFAVPGGLVCFALALVAFVRYGDLRWKAVQETYRFYIALRAQETIAAFESGKAAVSGTEDESA